MTGTIPMDTIAGKERGFNLWVWLRERVSAPQNAHTVRNLRLGVGVVGTLLPVMLIAGNRIMGDTTIIPSSMSSSYYTSTRNLFVGSLCALGGFLIGYRGDSRLQDLCTSLAGVCALLVAFFPTAPPPGLTPPQTEPAWISYLHLSAAAVLILTLGLFCLFAFAQAAGISPGLKNLYLFCGVLVLVSEVGAASTVIWPSGWQLLYLFEALAVFAFGTAWLAEPVTMLWTR